MKEAGTNLLHWLLNFSMVSIKRNSTDESLMWLISQENHNWWWLLFNLDHWLSKEKSVLLLERTKDGDISTDWHHQATEKSTKRSFIVAGTSQYKSDSDYFIKSEWCKDHVYRMAIVEVQQYLTKPNHCIWPIRTHYTFVSTNEQFAPEWRRPCHGTAAFNYYHPIYMILAWDLSPFDLKP